MPEFGDGLVPNLWPGDILKSGDKFILYVVEHGSDQSFAKNFWGSCEPLGSDLMQFEKFAKVLQLSASGMKRKRIHENTGIKASTISAWITLRSVPKLGCYLRAFLELGMPREGFVWLSVNSSHGHAIPHGPFVQVPLQITNWNDIELVIDNLVPIEGTSTDLSRLYLFGFLLGMVIGDSAKSKRGRFHRHLALVLSKRYPTNERIGDFTSLCAQMMGLRMHRITDQEKKRDKPHGFYVWVSQASLLIDWIFNICLGLKNGESTTYDAIHADWVLNAPEDFRRGLVQGLAESDGSVSISGQEVEFWVGPNFDFMKNLLGTFGLNAFRSREATSLSKRQAIKSFSVPVFSPILRTVRYERLRSMALGKKLPKGGERLPQHVTDEIKRLKIAGVSTPSIIEKVLETYGLLISFEAAQRWANR